MIPMYVNRIYEEMVFSVYEIKGLIFFYFKGKDTFNKITRKNECVNEIYGIFLFLRFRKKKKNTS